MGVFNQRIALLLLLLPGLLLVAGCPEEGTSETVPPLGLKGKGGFSRRQLANEGQNHKCLGSGRIHRGDELGDDKH